MESRRVFAHDSSSVVIDGAAQQLSILLARLFAAMTSLKALCRNRLANWGGLNPATLKS